MNIASLFRAAMSGHSLSRLLQNDDISRMVTARGKTIDLGAKSSASSYFEHIKSENGVTYTFVDLYARDEAILTIDLDEEFPVGDNSYDTAFLFNVLEHVYDTRNVLSETNRILRPGAKLFGGNPFMYKYHRDPSDYWRFTHEAMERLLVEAGFKDIRIIKSGVGCFTVATSQIAKRLRLKPLIFLSYLFGISMDKLLGRFIKSNDEFYIGIIFEATK